MKRLTVILVGLLFMNASYAITIDADDARTITAERIVYDVKSETIKTAGQTEIVNTSGQRMTLTDSYLSQKTGTLSGNDIKLCRFEFISF